MTLNVLMTLGDFQFEIAKNAFSELQRSRTHRWSEVATLSGTNVYHGGRASSTVQLSGVLHPVYLGEDGMEYMRRLRDMSDKAESHLLIAASGENFGRYVIESIQETYSNITRHAIPRRIEFQISLKEAQQKEKPAAKERKKSERRAKKK